MLKSNFIKTPQSLFPSQMDNEKIFIFKRRHFLYLVWQEAIVVFLILIPALALIIDYSGIITFLAALSVFVDDLIILTIMAYYLALISIFITNLLRYYFTQLVVTDRRIYLTKFQGFFSLLPHEFAIEEILEVSFRVRGVFGIVFNIGDITLHLQGYQTDYFIESVDNAEYVSGIINSIAEQAKNEIPEDKREPNQEIIGIIDRQLIKKGQQLPEIMNPSLSVKNAQQKIKLPAISSKGLKRKFDLWWWTQVRKEHVLYIGYKSTDLEKIAKTKGEDAKKGEK